MHLRVSVHAGLNVCYVSVTVLLNTCHSILATSEHKHMFTEHLLYLQTLFWNGQHPMFRRQKG